MTVETKTVHMSLCLPGVLGNWPRWKKEFRHLDGTAMRSADARKMIEDLVAEGVRVVPFSGKPCEGWSDVDGCPGHPREKAFESSPEVTQ